MRCDKRSKDVRRLSGVHLFSLNRAPPSCADAICHQGSPLMVIIIIVIVIVIVIATNYMDMTMYQQMNR